jgi:hypothetical protein
MRGWLMIELQTLATYRRRIGTILAVLLAIEVAVPGDFLGVFADTFCRFYC